MKNKIMLFDLLVFLVLIFTMRAASYTFMINHKNDWYLGFTGIQGLHFNFFAAGFEAVLTWWILLNQLVPLNLVIVLEITKIWYTDVI